MRDLLKALAGALLLAGVAGLTYEAIAAHRDRVRFPQRGCPVDAGGHKLNLVCSGQGTPTVVLEAGLTGLGAMWSPVQSAVPQFTRVCSYDRAGYGWSEPGPLPRTSRQIAQELHALLAKAGETPPIVLVGSSAGGYHVRVYAGLYGEQVAGMVLVDASHPDQAARFHLPANPLQEKERWEPFLPILYRFGILRLSVAREARPAHFSKLECAELNYLRDNITSMRTLLREAESIAEDAEEARNSGTLGDRPLIVLTGGRHPDPEVRRIWVDDLQAGLAHLSSRGRQVVLANVGHEIPFEDPDAIVTAIREIARAARN